MLRWQIDIQEDRGNIKIVNQAGNIHNNSDGLSRWSIPNRNNNPVYVSANSEPQILIEGINITDLGAEVFEEAIESYKQDKSFHILTSPLDKYCRNASLADSLEDIWEEEYGNGRFHWFDGILYHRYKHTFVIVRFVYETLDNSKNIKSTMTVLSRKI
ncbi:hypothetical protein O181_053595 [Austropuccinia psidii MF-1]|uniref:Uncharacterized protein n=1 Tax=Austropuccinia psidii MF-1 TaxID=1389203 RepID=A0A9Q3HTM7_9BASI|nr:hypothetical protein [Austropuccinia psidii MF-1]